MSSFRPVIEALEVLKEDPVTLKRVKEKAEEILLLLQKKDNLDKALRELEEFDSSELPAYDRTQLWDIISLLERLANSSQQ